MARLICALLVPGGPAPVEQMQAGERALQANDLDAAEPNSAAAHANLGVVYMRRANWKPALREFKRAAELAPQVAGIRLQKPGRAFATLRWSEQLSW